MIKAWTKNKISCTSRLLRAQTEVMAGWQEDALTLTRVGCDATLRCSRCTLLGSLSCCTYSQLCSVYNKLCHFLLWNGPKLHLDLFMFMFDICSSHDSSSQAAQPFLFLCILKVVKHRPLWVRCLIAATRGNSLHHLKTHYTTQPVFTLRYTWSVEISCDRQNP